MNSIRQKGPMRKAVMILFSALVLSSSIALMEIGERTITAGAFAILLVVVVFLYRRFRRSAAEIPWVFQAAAAIGVTLGVVTMLGLWGAYLFWLGASVLATMPRRAAAVGGAGA